MIKNPKIKYKKYLTTHYYTSLGRKQFFLWFWHLKATKVLQGLHGLQRLKGLKGLKGLEHFWIT